jgi:hypothetical protein
MDSAKANAACRYRVDSEALDPSLHSVTIDEIKVMQQMTVRY